MCKPIVSSNVTTRNVVLHITVPKRTGRRRRKGSTGPYMSYAETNGQASNGALDGDNRASARSTRHGNAGYLLRGLRDNEGSYKIKPVGVIEQTHRFRSTSTKSSRDAGQVTNEYRYVGLCILYLEQPVYDEDERDHSTIPVYLRASLRKLEFQLT